jgi:cytochrome b subunit of formate dehydrogenase
MKRMAKWFRRQEGQGLVEYALLICLVVLLVGGALMMWGQYLYEMFLHFIDILAAYCQF